MRNKKICKNFFIRKYFTNFAIKNKKTNNSSYYGNRRENHSCAASARGGVGKNGHGMETQDYVIETHEQYPRKCCFNVFGSDKIQLFNIQVGEELRVSFDIDAHEYQGRWFNSVRAWKVERIDPSMAQQPVAPAAPFAQPVSQMEAPAGQQGPVADAAPFPPQSEGGSEDDLPF